MSSRRERGEYRPIYESLLDGPEFQALDARARLVLIALKLKAGASGIRVLPGLREALGEWTGLRPKDVQAALKSLVGADWIRLEGSVVWVVRGLEFEPSLTSGNPKMRAYIQRQCEALPSLAIVDEFRKHYSYWFGDISEIPPEDPPDSHTPPPVDTHPDGDAVAMPSTSTTTLPTTEKTAAAARAREAPETLSLLARFDDPHRAVVARFLDAAPLDQREHIAATIAGWLSGQGWAGGRAMGPEDLASGLSDYLAQPEVRRTFTPMGFRAFVERAERARADGKRRRGPPPAEHAARAEELYGLVIEEHLGSLNGIQFDQAVTRLRGAGRLDDAGVLELRSLMPLRDLARARTREEGLRLAIERLTASPARVPLAVLT